MAIFPGGVATDADLVIAVNNKVTNLTSAINDSTFLIPVTSTAGFPSVGYITIDTEVIHYTSIGATQFNADVRGADGTTNVSHLDTTQVSQNINAAFHNLLKDEIKAIEGHISTLLGLSTTQAKFPNGSIAAPSITFANDPDTGFYSIADNAIRFISNGGQVALVDANTSLWPNGSALSPGVGFFGFSTTGIYGATNTLGFAVNGVGSMELTTTELVLGNRHFRMAGTGVLKNVDGLVSAPAYTFSAVTNMGMFRNGAELGFAVGGALQMSISSSAIDVNSNKITSLAAATANGDAVRFEQLNPGKILQVVSADMGAVVNNSTTTYADANLSVSITPSSTSSKVLVFAYLPCYAASPATALLNLLRDATTLIDPWMGAYTNHSGANNGNTASMSHLDSPSTTSSITYKVQIKSSSGGTNTGTTDGTSARRGRIIAIEIGQ